MTDAVVALSNFDTGFKLSPCVVFFPLHNTKGHLDGVEERRGASSKQLSLWMLEATREQEDREKHKAQNHTFVEREQRFV